MYSDRSGIIMNTSNNQETEYALKWLASSYMKTITGALGGLRDHGMLCDVTLSCQGKQVHAHRVLLAACSPYFKSVFEDNPSTHPVIVFRDFQHEDLLDLIHFIYHGEVEVPRHRLTSFLSTAQLLNIQGLSGLDNEPRDEAVQILKDNREVNASCIEPKRKKLNKKHCDNGESNENDIEIVNIPEDIQMLENIDGNDVEVEQSPSDLSKPKNEDSLNIKTELAYDLQTDSVMKDTTQVADGDKFRCQLCWKGFKHPTSLTLHKDSHTGKTQCPVCHRSFSRSYDMRSHLMKIHQDQPTSEMKSKITKPPFGNAT